MRQESPDFSRGEEVKNSFSIESTGVTVDILLIPFS